jgi:hypothetical protein
MTLVTRILKVGAAILGVFLYVWYAAVRSVPTVKRRKRRKHGR